MPHLVGGDWNGLKIVGRLFPTAVVALTIFSFKMYILEGFGVLIRGIILLMQVERVRGV